MSSSAPAQQAPKKRALLIGINDYKRPTHDGKFDDLDSANDVAAIKTILMQKFRFMEAEIKTLTSKEETKRDSILKAFEDFLVKPTNEGDIVFFYYAGHGSQVADPNEPDGLDETLVPSDYADDGSRDIRDKEVAALLAEIKARKPATVMLGFDSCHSATAFRAEKTPFNRVRGMGWEERYGRLKPKPNVTSQTMTKLASDDPLGTGFVIFSATRDEDLALQMADDERKPVGRLSYFLSKAMLEAGPDTTYADLFERVQAQMAQRFPGQVPSIAGDKNKRLLEGTAAPVEKYFGVYVSNDNKNMLRAGFLHGMTKDSEFSLYASGERDFTPAKSIAEAKIVSVGAFESVIEVTRQIKPDFKPGDLQAARAVEKLHRYGDNRLKLNLSDFDQLSDKTKILAALAPLIGADGPVIPAPPAGQQPDVRLVMVSREELDEGRARAEGAKTSPRDTPALIRRDDGSIIEALRESADRPQKLAGALVREAKYRTVRLLENESRETSVLVEMRLVPADVVSENGLDVWKRDLPPRKNGKSFAENEWVTIEVRNIGAEDAYISLLDLQRTGDIQQLWPPLDPTKPVTNKLSKDQKTWHKLWTGNYNTPWPIQITPPYGTEMFKLIVTREPVDLSGITTRAPTTPIQELLKAAMSGTRAKRGNVPTEWSTATQVIKVTK
jgi:hypothetical protein